MFEYLEELLKEKYNYNLDQKKMCKAPIEKNKVILPVGIIFGIVLLGYILILAGVLPELYNFIVVLVFFIISVVMLIVFGPKRSKYAALIITPKYLIQVLGVREFVIIEFDKISKYFVTQKGEMILYEGSKKIVIEGTCYEGKLSPLVDILEAKGKTFDKKKDYMVRPVEIIIENDEVILKDIEVINKIDIVFDKYYKDYKMLTPGFIKDIIFRNAVVEEVIIDENELVLKLDHYEVNPGHPENTKFESIIVEDCVVIFSEVKVKKVSKIDTHEKEAKIEKLANDLDSFADEIESGVIAEWTAKGKTFHVKFAAGVYLYDVSFSYEDVICGWNKTR